jgi:DNA-binding transcriptional LysR family regulator
MIDRSILRLVQYDLNLLRVLDALLEEGSVTGAAARLHLSPPAASRALRRLRRVTGDEILTRNGPSMTPTPRALEIRADVHALLEHAESVLAPTSALELESLERTFTLRCHDALVGSVGQSVLQAVRTFAPGVQLRFVAETTVDTTDLRQGRIDIEVNAGTAVDPALRSERVAHDELATIGRADHPYVINRRGDRLARFLAAEHLIVSRRGSLTDPLDRALAALGRSRRVVATVPTATSALELVRDGNLLMTAPVRALTPLANALGLRTAPLPIPATKVPLVMSWPKRYDNDRAHAWLRDQVRLAIHDI